MGLQRRYTCEAEQGLKDLACSAIAHGWPASPSSILALFNDVPVKSSQVSIEIARLAQKRFELCPEGPWCVG